MCLTWNLQKHLECTQDVFVGFQAPLPPVSKTLIVVRDVIC